MSRTGSGVRSGGGPQVPTSVDHYRIVCVIGRGGQGEVFLGHDPNLDIDVAVKKLHKDYYTEEFINRFKVEARTSVRLTAPNIVRIYNFNPEGLARYPDGSIEECAYLVMEYCGNGDLNRVIKSRKQFTLRESYSIIRQIGEALIAAHTHDPPILHRDLKPGNVLFQKDVPKVADFGLAKMLGSAKTGLTTTRGMMGTVGYASPEQLKDASRVDHRTDIWALGVILYELLTFRRPFQKPGDDYVNVAVKVRTEPPTPPPFELPQPLWELIQHTLQKEPADRIGTAREFMELLDQVLARIPEPDRLILPPPETLTEVDRLACEAAQLLDGGSTQSAADRIEAMRQASPDDTLPKYWVNQLLAARQQEASSGTGGTVSGGTLREAQELESRLNSVQALMRRHQFTDALRLIGELLARYPDKTVVHNYISRINEARAKLNDALNEAHEQADQAQAAGDVEGVHRIWKAMDERFPAYADIQTELAIAVGQLRLKEIEKLRERAERTATKLLDGGDVAGAIAVWDDYLAKYPDDSKAREARGKVVEQKRAGERAERLAALREKSERLRSDGKLEEALAVWEDELRRDPGAEAAATETERLRNEIRVERLAGRLTEARRQAKALIDAGDHRGALRVWGRILEEFPDNAEAATEVEALGRDVTAHEQAALREQIGRQVAVLEQRLACGRYARLPEARAKLVSALDAASESGASNDGLGGLMTATEEAETLLRSALAGHRAELMRLYDEAAEVHGEREGPDGPAGDEALGTAFDRAAQALCQVQCEGDALTPLVDASGGLRAALDRYARERATAVEQVRSVAEEALSRADTALAALAAQKSSRERSESPDMDQFREALERVRGQVKAASVVRLETAAAEARALEAATSSARMQRLWVALEELRRERDGALEAFVGSHDERLAASIRSASGILVSSDGAALSAPELSVLTTQLREQAGAVRGRQAERLAAAWTQWEQSVTAWSHVFTKGKDPEIDREAASLAKTAELALTTANDALIRQVSARLAALARRTQIQSAWRSQEARVRALEDAAESKTRDKLLTRYRQALAKGAADELRTLDAQLEEQSQTLEDEQPAGAPTTPRISAVSDALRAFNKRLYPAGLAQFDQAFAEYERAARGGDGFAMTRLAAEVEQCHDRLLQPSSSWPKFVPASASVVVVSVIAVALWLVTQPKPVSVSVVSAAGNAHVDALKRDNSRVPLPEDLSSVGEQGVRWSLSPGNYVVELSGGSEVRFSVPATSAVVLPARDMMYTNELVEALDLKRIFGSEAHTKEP